MTTAAIDQDERTARAFAIFHAENPEVYDDLRELALMLHRVGGRCGIRQLCMVRQANASLESSGESVSVSRQFEPHYRELLENSEHRLVGFFRRRNFK